MNYYFLVMRNLPPKLVKAFFKPATAIILDDVLYEYEACYVSNNPGFWEQDNNAKIVIRKN